MTITIYAVSAYHHKNSELEPHSWRGVLDTTLCDKVCQWLTTDHWFSPGPHGTKEIIRICKSKKGRQYNDQKTEGQTIQWPKDRRVDNTMTKRQKDRQ
jgi:hypothetical protein